GPAAHHRALLPCGPGALTRARRHRAWARNRQAPRARARRRALDRERARAWNDRLLHPSLERADRLARAAPEKSAAQTQVPTPAAAAATRSFSTSPTCVEPARSTP